MGYCMKRATLDYGLAGGCEYADYYAPEQTGEYLTVCGYFIDYLREDECFCGTASPPTGPYCPAKAP